MRDSLRMIGIDCGHTSGDQGDTEKKPYVDELLRKRRLLQNLIASLPPYQKDSCTAEQKDPLYPAVIGPKSKPISMSFGFECDRQLVLLMS